MTNCSCHVNITEIVFLHKAAAKNSFLDNQPTDLAKGTIIKRILPTLRLCFYSYNASQLHTNHLQFSSWYYCWIKFEKVKKTSLVLIQLAAGSENSSTDRCCSPVLRLKVHKSLLGRNTLEAFIRQLPFCCVRSNVICPLKKTP